MTPDDFLRLLVPSIFDHFDGDCFPDQDSVAGLRIDETAMYRRAVTVEGTDPETRTPFFATIRVHVRIPSTTATPGR
ncbi:hypothetical protein ACTWP5_18870 [Streptomyces sp. 4N509B]|uniref:hypothetical protein n=1 Tax=Streptomyces sp. 4N509B TaxID=3457413 RepID=UPI003FD5B2DC